MMPNEVNPYKHKYYIAYMDKDESPFINFQRSEVSKVEWLPYDKCFDYIRPYNLERIDTVKRVHHILTHYKFF